MAENDGREMDRKKNPRHSWPLLASNRFAIKVGRSRHIRTFEALRVAIDADSRTAGYATLNITARGWADLPRI